MSFSHQVKRGLKFLESLYHGDKTDLNALISNQTSMSGWGLNTSKIERAIMNLSVIVANHQEVKDALKEAGTCSCIDQIRLTANAYATCERLFRRVNTAIPWSNSELDALQRDLHDSYQCIYDLNSRISPLTVRIDIINPLRSDTPRHIKDAASLKLIVSILEQYPKAIKKLPLANRHP